jgi:hypothetical protein
MLGLPTHSIFLVKEDGSKENVMNTDCSTKSEVRNEVKYLFDKCGYKKDNYTKVQYGNNQKIFYEFNISELEG